MKTYVKIGLALGALGALAYVIYRLANGNTVFSLGAGKATTVSVPGASGVDVTQLPAAGG